MTYDQFVNFILLMIAVGLVAYVYFKYYITADASGKKFVKAVSAIGMVIWIVDTFVSRW